MPLRFRVGIHSGEVMADGDRLFGLDLIIVERLQALSPPGGLCLSDAAEADAPPELRELLRPIASRSLKDMPRALRAYSFDPSRRRGSRVTVDEPPSPRTMASASPAGDPGIVLLPLDNRSADPANQHLCDGFTADLISALSRFPNLSIIARHSAFQFRDSPEGDLAAVARTLGVRYLARGSLLHARGRIQVRIELIDTFTEAPLWADRLDAPLRDVFEVQDELTGTLASRLAIEITEAERRRLRRHHVPELSTYGLLLRGEALAYAMRPEKVKHARRLFEQAATLDPDYGRSHAALARTFNTEWFYGFGSAQDEALDRSLQLSLRAVECDPYDARGFAELGYAHLYLRRHDESLAAYERALDLNPNDADILAEYGDLLVYSGQGQKALSVLQRALILNPRPPDWYYWHLCDAYGYLRQYDRVLETAGRLKEPSAVRRLRAVAHVYLGDMQAAQREAQLILREQPGFTVSRWAERPPYRPGDEAAMRYIEGLRRAGLPA